MHVVGPRAGDAGRCRHSTRHRRSPTPAPPGQGFRDVSEQWGRRQGWGRSRLLAPFPEALGEARGLALLTNSRAPRTAHGPAPGPGDRSRWPRPAVASRKTGSACASSGPRVLTQTNHTATAEALRGKEGAPWLRRGSQRCPHKKRDQQLGSCFPHCFLLFKERETLDLQSFRKNKDVRGPLPPRGSQPSG